jgi:hypothetical protein
LENGQAQLAGLHDTIQERVDAAQAAASPTPATIHGAVDAAQASASKAHEDLQAAGDEAQGAVSLGVGAASGAVDDGQASVSGAQEDTQEAIEGGQTQVTGISHALQDLVDKIRSLARGARPAVDSLVDYGQELVDRLAAHPLDAGPAVAQDLRCLEAIQRQPPNALPGIPGVWNPVPLGGGDATVLLPLDATLLNFAPACVTIANGGKVTMDHRDTGTIHDPATNLGACFGWTAEHGNDMVAGQVYELSFDYDAANRHLLVSSDGGASWRSCDAATAVLSGEEAVIPYVCNVHPPFLGDPVGAVPMQGLIVVKA